MTTPTPTPAEQLLARLRGWGCRLWVEEKPEGLEPRLAGDLAPDDRQALASQREAVLRVLVREAQDAACARDDDAAALDRAICWQDRPRWNWCKE